MNDGRDTLALGGTAAVAFEGLVPAARYVPAEPMGAIAPITPLRRSPEEAAEQLDQLLFGEAFDVLERSGDWAFGQARRDGYVGYARLEGLRQGERAPSHWVCALSTWAHAEPAIRAPASGPISLGSLLVIEEEAGEFVRAADLGWLPRAHVRAIGEHEGDFVAVAERCVGIPYLWGGRSSAGLDCSGLVMQALFACGSGCPRDSDQQALLGEAAAASERRRGDLIFWRGHVGIMVDGERLLHANAHHMAVAVEPLAAARSRIAANGGGEWTAIRRPPLASFRTGRGGIG